MSGAGGGFCPVLKPSDILEVMQQLEIPITEDDFTKPQPQRVQQWYEAFLFILKGVSLDQLGSNTEVEMVDITDYPECHEDDIFIISFYMQMSKLMRDVGMNDFSLRDMLKPERNRVIRILSSICNFAMFRDDRMPILEKHTLKWEQALQRSEQLQSKIQEIKEKIDDVKLQRESEESDVIRTQEENAELRSELEGLISNQKMLMEQLDDLKEEKERLEGKLATSTEESDKLKLEITRLKARVVHSPEKIQQAIVDLNAQITSAREQLLDNEKRSRKLTSKIGMLEALYQEIQASIRSMQECKDVVEQQEEEMQKLLQNRETIGQLESDINGHKVTKEQLEYTNSNADIRMTRLENTHEKKRAANSERLKKLQVDRIQALEQLEATRRKISEKKAYLDNLAQKISAEKRNIQEEIAQTQSQYDVLRRQTFVYQDEIGKLLAIFFDNLTE
ncbi:kinetochore-associated Ndc80 complex subunit nuf2 [Mycoemilia scoparia]|uniref:Kinetochore-associated Ndc80 complex subunit nuf2 n=1 Tax=Mycoemilia scoparia TaxID=417184 RepID=A0A9W7ZXU1_9FUNG|nr:kinetochore-associated Ndc80 complex subunit nuf2 [Mycoemilia scoparia]